MTATVLDQAIHQTEVELALRGLDRLPRESGQDGIEVQIHHTRPDRPHVLEVRGTGVVQFAAEGEKWSTVYDQLGRRALFSYLHAFVRNRHRLVWVALPAFWSRWSTALVIVKPDTVAG
jgi:hypothetical protein